MSCVNKCYEEKGYENVMVGVDKCGIILGKEIGQGSCL